MPRIATLGVTAARAYGFGSGSRSARWVSGAIYNTSASGTITVTWSGCQAGDIAVIAMVFTTMVGPSGWTLENSGMWPGFAYPIYLYKKVLSGSDVASGTPVSYGAGPGPAFGGLAISSAWRGAGSISMVGAGPQAANGTNVNVMTGFSKNAACLGVVVMVFDRDATNTDIFPAGWAKHIANTAPGGFFTGTVGDVTPNGYANGSTISVANNPGFTGTDNYLLQLLP